MSELYQELKDIAIEDSTVHAYLKAQRNNGASDLHTATMMIRQLAKEKKTYFDMALKKEHLSPDIRGFVGELHGVKIISKAWYQRLDFWNYTKVAKGVWIRK